MKSKRKIEIKKGLNIDFGQENLSIEAKMSIYKLLARIAECNENVSQKASVVLFIACQILGLNKNKKTLKKTFVVEIIAIILIFGGMGTLVVGGMIFIELDFIIVILIFGILPIFGGVLILRHQKNKENVENMKSKTIEKIGNELDKRSNDELTEYLSDFTSIQKKWFLKATIFLMESDPLIRQKEVDYIQPVFSKMGINKKIQ